jgi:hypothetical protein
MFIASPKLMQQIGCAAGQQHIDDVENYISQLICNITGYTIACKPAAGVYWPEFDVVFQTKPYARSRCFAEIKFCKTTSGYVEVGSIDQFGFFEKSGLTATQASVFLMITPTQCRTKGKLRVIKTDDLLQLYQSKINTINFSKNQSAPSHAAALKNAGFTVWNSMPGERRQSVTMPFNFNQVDDLFLVEFGYNNSTHEFVFDRNTLVYPTYGLANYRRWFEHSLQ